MSQYQIDTTIDLQGVFINALTGVYADPTTITLYILDPNGFQTTQVWPGGNIARDSLGHFNFLLTPSIPGNWFYKWRGTGTATATSPDTTITVLPSVLTLPHVLIFSINRSSAPRGTLITIIGTGFAGATSVFIDGVSASFTVIDDNTITATVP
jgi:hypothetical protein